MTKNLILISDGGFSTQKRAYIDQFALNLCTKSRPRRLYFIGTASHDATSYYQKFQAAFPVDITNQITTKQMAAREFVDTPDLVYIGGGDPHYLLTTWRQYQFDQQIQQWYKQGVVMVGVSAGAMIWFSQVYDEKVVTPGLEVIAGSLCPHYEELAVRKDYALFRQKSPQLKHYLLTKQQNLHFQDEQLMAEIKTFN